MNAPIFENDDLKVFWLPGERAPALLTFADLVTANEGARFYADTPARQLNHPCLGFAATRPNWYPAPAMQQAWQHVARLVPPGMRRVAYGGSMGGYAAIKFSKLIGADTVIAYCPQWTIDPAMSEGHSLPWTGHFDPAMAGMEIAPDDVAGHVFVFVDLLDETDRFHAERIAAQHAATTLVNIPSVGHHVTSVMAGTQTLDRILQACLAGDVLKLRGLTRETRKRHFTAAETILRRAAIRYPALAARIMAAHLPRDLRYQKVFASLPESFRRAVQTLLAADPLASVAAADAVAQGSAMRTIHGSWVRFAPDTGRAFHRLRFDPPLPVSDLPVTLHIRGDQAVLRVQDGDASRPLAPDPEGHLIAQRHGAFRLERIDATHMALSHDGRYLCADPEGRLACRSPQAREWEWFSSGDDASG